MSLHWIKIIESGHMSTQRLFDLGLSFGVCRRKRHWPSLETMNSFLKEGTDDGKLGTTIEWEPCELTEQEYVASVTAVMNGEPFNIDSRRETWKEWVTRISDENAA